MTNAEELGYFKFVLMECALPDANKTQKQYLLISSAIMAQKVRLSCLTVQ
jgi:hypothetical protein